jgi:hypothetical protein
MGEKEIIPEHIIEKANKYAIKAGVSKRKIKFIIIDHVAFIQSLGGTVTWPEKESK